MSVETKTFDFKASKKMFDNHEHEIKEIRSRLKELRKDSPLRRRDLFLKSFPILKFVFRAG